MLNDPAKKTRPFKYVVEKILPILIEFGLNKEPPLFPILIVFPPNEFVKLRLLQFKSVIDNGFTNDFDLSDFIHHQDDLDNSQVYLTLPEGTQIVKMDDYHKVPVAAIRDIKIDKIIE
jgi:hypothetical protein